LRAGFAARATDLDLFRPSVLARLSLAEFTQHFGTAFERAGNLAQRHRNFVEVAAALARADRVDVSGLLDRPVRLGGPDGLYARLVQIPAFGRDPGQKKVRIVVQELCRTGLLTPTDPEYVRPAIEYHLIRLYLRTERVTPRLVNDRTKLADGAVLPLPAITSLREGVELAMYYTADAAEVPVYDLNTIEWQIGRSFCVRSGPRCAGPPIPEKPLDSTVAVLSSKNDAKCPFAGPCIGHLDDQLSAMKEPELSRKYDFY
jgi:hypothetical protein